jgi:urease accessory protein
MTLFSIPDGSREAPSCAPDPTSRLDLAFARGPDGRTFIARQHAGYPFHVCRPHYLDREPEGLATLYVQSCAGGLFEDDDIRCDVIAAPGSAVHLTTSAATIVHSSRRGGQAKSSTSIRVGPNALVEYLPDPLILFPEARLRSRLDLAIEGPADIIVSDAFIVHDPDGRHAHPAAMTATICAHNGDGRLLARDRMNLNGEQFLPGRPGVLGAWKCHGMLMVFSSSVHPDSLCNALRISVGAFQEVYAGVSTLPNDAGVCARFLTADAVLLRALIASAWKESRRLLTGHEPVERRK